METDPNTYNMNHDKIKRLTGQRETEWDEVPALRCR